MKIAEAWENFLNYRFLLDELVSREFKLKYKRSVLGILWSVLNPLLMMIILNIVFSRLFRFAIPNFVVYYLTGSLFFGFMQEATNGALFSIIGNTGLIMKVYIPKYIFPIAKTISAFVNFLFSLIALAIVGGLTGIVPGFSLLLLPFLFVFLFFFVLGLTLIFSTYTVFFRDLIHFHGIFMMLWMYLTPIFYPENIFPEKMAWILGVNPLYYYIRGFREIVLNNACPELYIWISCILISIMSLVIGLFVLKKIKISLSFIFRIIGVI